MPTSNAGVSPAASTAMDQHATSCSQCGRDVPTANIVLHEATCSRFSSNQRQPRPSQRVPESSSEPQSETQSLLPPIEQGQTIRETQPERGQTTLDSWLATARSTSSGGVAARSSTSTINGDAAGEFSNSSDLSSTVDSSSSARHIALNHNSNVGGSSNDSITGSDSADTSSTDVSSSLEDRNAASSTTSGVHVPNSSTANDGNATATASDSTSDSAIEPLIQQQPEGDIAPQNDNQGWVNVAYNPQFRYGINGIIRVQTELSFIEQIQNSIQSRLPLNPLVHGGPFGTFARVLNGLINGAIVGSTLYDFAGLLIGLFLGFAGGLYFDVCRNAEDERQERATREVVEMLATDGGGIAAGTFRVHRGSGYITALASDSQRRSRIIRMRYGDGLRARLRRGPGPGDPSAGAQHRDNLERGLLEILVQMSYSRDFGPGRGHNLVLQPEESFEEMLRRFELGNENRGASDAVIDSYPVEIVRREDAEESGSESDDENSSDASDSDSSDGSYETDDDAESDSESDSGSSRGSSESDAYSDMGTCGICLEHYREGDVIKRLGCPTHPHCFHRDCIDKWLKVQARCPICKHHVTMFKDPTHT